MKKKGLPEILVRSVMSLYEGAMRRVRMDSAMSEEFEDAARICVITFFSVVVDVTEFARKGVLRKLLCADDLVLMSETIMGLRNKFMKWKEAFESNGLKVNLGEIKVMVNGGITEDGLSKSKIDSCGVCCLRVMVNPVLCVQCCKWIHGRCAGAKRVTAKFYGSFACRKSEGNIGEAVEQDKTLCDEMKTVKEFTYHGDRVSAGGGCEAAVTARRRCGWVRLGSVVSCCVAGEVLQSSKGLFMRLM